MDGKPSIRFMLFPHSFKFYIKRSILWSPNFGYSLALFYCSLNINSKFVLADNRVMSKNDTALIDSNFWMMDKLKRSISPGLFSNPGLFFVKGKTSKLSVISFPKQTG
ncbi:MAG: hypothetical protein KAQ75_12950 [Bacteroidales bacterium]|nr:hypothetical protein [Bacteroidales bacterium]